MKRGELDKIIERRGYLFRFENALRRVSSGVVVLEPEQAAVAAAKILAVHNKDLHDKIKAYREQKRQKIENDDKEVRQNG